MGGRMNRSTILALLAGSVAAAPRALAAQTAAPKTVTVALTAKTASEWPFYVAVAQGFYAAHGIKPDFIYAGAAASGMQQLLAGAVEMSETSSTLLVQSIQSGAPVTAFMERTTAAPYLILGRKGLTSIAQLKGKTIIIGGPADITRVFADKALAQGGLKPDDYTYTYAGATTERYAALVSGGVDAAILFPPFSFRGEAEGYPLLADITKVFPAFIFDAFTARSDWAQKNPEIVTAFTRAYIDAVRWFYDPANKSKAMQILQQETNSSADDIAKTYELFVSKHIFSRNALVQTADIAVVLDAMVKIDQLKAPVPAPAKFFDNRYANAANARR
jgi:NitT/TauT family transport system substrate-binding protein